MVPDINAIYNLVKDIHDFRERLSNEIPEICNFDSDLADHIIDARSALFTLYKDLDQILVENDC